MNIKDHAPRSFDRRSGHIRTAMFVDFDNIYIGLNNLDSQAAESFVNNPADWLRWIENGMPAVQDGCPESEEHGSRRSLLIRNCYLNPRTFYRFRPYFTRAAFTIVDCPPLTEKGKTSSDIRMVMDVLDTLKHETRFDEFILLSGDADFTPVLQRLRAHDRRTTVLAVGPASEAYKAACDYLISVDNFIEFALGVSGVEPFFGAAGEPQPEGGEADRRLLEQISAQLHARACAEGEIPAYDLARIYREFEIFRNSSDWLGYGSLRRLTQAVVATGRDLALIDSDPWKVVLAVPEVEAGNAPHDDGRPEDEHSEEADSHRRETSADLSSCLAGFIQRIHNLTHVPDLTPQEYAKIFRTLETVLRNHPYHFTGTSKMVRDRCVEQGHGVSRATISFILRGISYGGHRFGLRPDQDSAATFAEVFRRNVRNLCADADLDLSAEDMRLLETWITADQEPEPAPADDPGPALDEAAE